MILPAFALDAAAGCSRVEAVLQGSLSESTPERADLEQSQCDGKTRMQCHQAKFGQQVWRMEVLGWMGQTLTKGRLQKWLTRTRWPP